MNKIFDLAKDFEQKSTEQAKTIEVDLAHVFKAHESAINAALHSSGQRISSAIQEQSLVMRWMVLKSWLSIGVGLLVMLCLGGSVLWWQGTQIRENAQLMTEQSDTLKKLNAKTWGVRFQGYERSLFSVTEGRESEPELDVRGRDTAGRQIGEEVNKDDSIRAGVIERLRSVTTELRDAATSVVGKLQRVAGDVRDYFRTGGNLERAEHPLVSESEQIDRAGERLKWSGTELKQASVEYQRQIRRDSPRFKGLEL